MVVEVYKRLVDCVNVPFVLGLFLMLKLNNTLLRKSTLITTVKYCVLKKEIHQREGE